MGSDATRGKGAVTGGDVVVYEEKGGRVRLGAAAEGRLRALARSDALAMGTGVSRASLIERGMRAVLEAGDRL